MPKEGQGGKGKKMSAAEEELQMTEEALAPEKLVSLSQVCKLLVPSLVQTVCRECLLTCACIGSVYAS